MIDNNSIFYDATDYDALENDLIDSLIEKFLSFTYDNLEYYDDKFFEVE